MRLTRYTDYALRVLIFVALRQGRGVTTIQEIADGYGISRNHLMKVVHHLGRLGYLETARGKGGGLRLARRPEDMRLGALVAELEQGRALVECFDAAANTCRITRACRLAPMLAEAERAFFDALDGHTLADVLSRDAALAEALALDAQPLDAEPQPPAPFRPA